MNKRIILGFSLTVFLIVFPRVTGVGAVYYTPQEKTRISQYQAEYQQIDNTTYNSENLYNFNPNLDYPFKAGQLKSSYENTSLKWINYYRQLEGLSNVTMSSNDNSSSQLAAAAMAAANSNPYVDQHGLSNSTKPAFISSAEWQQAQYVTAKSNLYFRNSAETAGYPISSLVEDNTNIEGNNTGHRAWILSAKLSQVGIGAAYNNDSSMKYEVMYVVNDQDTYANPQKKIVNYPSEGLFPYEELEDFSVQGTGIPWSTYFSDMPGVLTDRTSVFVKNLTDGSSSPAQSINKISNNYGYTYGNYSAILTYLPGKSLKLNNNSQYQVTISGLNPQYFASGQYTYTFKTFSQTSAPQQESADDSIEVPQNGNATVRSTGKVPVYNSPKSNHKATGKYLDPNSIWKVDGMNNQNGVQWFHVGTNQWVSGIYLETLYRKEKGVVKVVYRPNMGITLWNSPYANKKPYHRILPTGSGWKYDTIAVVNGIPWFRVSTYGWIDGRYII